MASLPRVSACRCLHSRQDETRQLAESMAGPLPVQAHELIARVAEGSPFMAAETLRALVSHGGLRTRGAPGNSIPVDQAPNRQTTLRAAAALTGGSSGSLPRLAGF